MTLATAVAELRSRHHALAQAEAAGIAEDCAKLATLRQDPAFCELVAHYRRTAVGETARGRKIFRDSDHRYWSGERGGVCIWDTGITSEQELMVAIQLERERCQSGPSPAKRPLPVAGREGTTVVECCDNCCRKTWHFDGICEWWDCHKEPELFVASPPPSG